MGSYYLESIYKMLKRELETATQRVVFCSPYLTPRTAESVIESAPVEHAEVYTRFYVELFASGASSIRTLRRLISKGYKVYELPRLHAKVVLISGQFVSIGSQNLTANGMRNQEATGISTDPDDVAGVEALLEPWLADRRRITIEMIDDVEAILPPVRGKFREARKLAEEADASIRLRVEERDNESLGQEQRQAAMLEVERLQEERHRAEALEAARRAEALEAARKFEEQRQAALLEVERSQEERRRAEALEATRIFEKQKHALNLSPSNDDIIKVRAKIRELIPDGKVPLNVAQHFVRSSAWWYTHRYGPCRAAGHAERITGLNGNWKIEFGANTFLVGKAIERCAVTCEKFLNSIEEGNPWSGNTLHDRLWHAVTGSVGNFRGAEFENYRPNFDGHMQFGAQSINVHDFVSLILQLIPLELRG